MDRYKDHLERVVVVVVVIFGRGRQKNCDLNIGRKWDRGI
jgi:hypothetical protein